MSLPISYTKIEEYLYLGNFETATNENVLTKLGVKRVLTLREFGISDEKKVSGIEYLHIPINDTPNDDILTQFPKCHRFIDEGRNNQEIVYVHCRLGVSRSATIVISYIMSLKQIHWEEALKLVRKLRKEVKPNPSFLSQLKLYYEMDYSLNALHLGFRQFLLKRWIYVMKKKIVSNSRDTDETILDKYFSLLSLSEEAQGSPYGCGKCKTVLFRELNVVRDLTQTKEDRPRYQCQYLMTEPQEWMLPNVSSKPIGSIQCPTCQATVGDYNWQRSLCSCILHEKCKPYQVFRFLSTSLV